MCSNAAVADSFKSALQHATEDLITNYHELNSSFPDELQDHPTALEFMRYVHLNRPFVVRNGARDWAAVQTWNATYLKDLLTDTPVNVACTPLGNADSVLQFDDGSLAFVKPYELQEPFNEALSHIQQQELVPTDPGTSCIRYLQTQNDNLREEYSAVLDDVPEDIPFARIALQKPPDAINFWLGNSSSTTALHKDNYENIYIQVVGQKHFVLLPPIEAACVNEQELPAATYKPVGQVVEQLEAHLDSPGASGEPAVIPFAVWDPDVPEVRPTFASHLSKPMRITLKPGDMLYLPAQWYHKVKQTCSQENICIAVNYWYDMEFAGGFHCMTSFTRDTAKLLLQADGAGNRIE